MKKYFSWVYITEPILNPFISYPDMKTKYPIKVIDVRHQSDHITPKKFSFFTYISK